MKSIVSIKYMTILLYIVVVNVSYSGDPKEPTPTPCCPPGCEPQATYTCPNPKGEPILEGQMTDLEIHKGGQNVTGQQLCVDYGLGGHSFSNPLFVLNMVGGDDKDVCVNTTEETCCGVIGVEEQRTWTCDPAGGGSRDPNNHSNFRFYPQLAEDENCKTYSITAKSDDTGECNAGDEQKTASVTIDVWQCIHEVKTASGAYFITFFPFYGTGNVEYGCISKYKDCNGNFTGIDQTAVTGLNVTGMDPQTPWDFAAQHTFVLGSNEQGWTAMGTCTGYCYLAPGHKCKCSYDTSSYSYQTVQENGLQSRFKLGPFTIEEYAGIPYFHNVNVALTTERCCQ